MGNTRHLYLLRCGAFFGMLCGALGCGSPTAPSSSAPNHTLMPGGYLLKVYPVAASSGTGPPGTGIVACVSSGQMPTNPNVAVPVVVDLSEGLWRVVPVNNDLELNFTFHVDNRAIHGTATGGARDPQTGVSAGFRSSTLAGTVSEGSRAGGPVNGGVSFTLPLGNGSCSANAWSLSPLSGMT
jgi:hypothetical protein